MPPVFQKIRIRSAYLIMEKRLILAVTLSILVLLAWSALAPKQPIETHVLPDNSQIAKPIDQQALPAIGQDPAALPETKLLADAALVDLSTEKLKFSFIEPAAAIKELTFQEYQQEKLDLGYGLLLPGESVAFQLNQKTSSGLVFVQKGKTKKIIKDFIFSKDNYSMELSIIIENLSNLKLDFDLPIILGLIDLSKNTEDARFINIIASRKGKVVTLNPKKDFSADDLKFIAIRDKYFAVVLQPEKNFVGYVKKIGAQKSEVGVVLKNVTVEPGQNQKLNFRIYLGPQDLKQIQMIEKDWAGIINYGTFDIISQLMLQLLEFFYKIVHNWGVAIIILSIAIFLLLFPFTLKQMRSMKEMQALQPRIEALRKVYKDNPQKLNKEMLALYKEHKVNPFGGCLPLLLQMPVFFALYQVMMRSIALKGESFLWIKDLAEPDRLFMLPFSLPVFGNEVNILPLLMTGLMFLQQKFSFVPSSGSSAEQQKIMMIVMPLMFGLIFYHMPSGLVLYWFFNSLLMSLYQFKISRGK